MSKKVTDQEEIDIPAENASPVCYINADELRHKSYLSDGATLAGSVNLALKY